MRNKSLGWKANDDGMSAFKREENHYCISKLIVGERITTSSFN
jgi:hypothetical protein